MGRQTRPAWYAALAAGFGLTAAVVPCARAWSPLLEISHASTHERSTPRVARGASGNLYVVYINKGSPWQVYFRERGAAGVWGAVQQIPSTFSTRPHVTEDGLGRPHVLFAATHTSGALDLVHAVRTGGLWNVQTITSTAGHEDQPHVVTDSLGRIHLVFTRSGVESSAGDVVYRLWNGTAWGGETVIGRVNQSFYNRPDISVDPEDNVHVTWVDKSGSVFKVRYRRLSGGAWSNVVDAGSGADSASFFSYPRIAALSAGHVLVVWHDSVTGGGSNIMYNHSATSGASWAFGLSGQSQGQILHAGHYPNLDAGAGVAHLVNSNEPGQKALVYSRWDGSSWTLLKQVIVSNAYWKGWPDIAVDAFGMPHAVWDEAYGPNTGQHLIAYSTTAGQGVPPAPPLQFVATAGHNRVLLSWTNPADADFERTVVRASMSAFPRSPTAGLSVVELPGTPGSAGAFEHTDVVNGTTYYYAAFARDYEGLYSSHAAAWATPYVPPDLDRDGDVDLADFGIFQRCLSGAFVPQTDPPCALARFDSDDDVDQDDAAVFLRCLSGPDQPYAPACAD